MFKILINPPSSVINPLHDKHLSTKWNKCQKLNQSKDSRYRINKWNDQPEKKSIRYNMKKHKSKKIFLVFSLTAVWELINLPMSFDQIDYIYQFLKIRKKDFIRNIPGLKQVSNLCCVCWQKCTVMLIEYLIVYWDFKNDQLICFSIKIYISQSYIYLSKQAIYSLQRVNNSIIITIHPHRVY